MGKQLHDDVSYLCCLSFWENLTPAAAAAAVMCEVKKHEEGEGIYQNKGASSSRNSFVMTKLWFLLMLLTSSFFTWCKSLDFG
jgi:hypothetical protein